MQKQYLSLIVASLLLITGCSKDDSSSNGNSGDSNNSSDGSKQTKITSTFIDSAVEGLTINCGTENHVKTDKKGAFSHFKDEECQFKLGENLLGSMKLKASTVVTPKMVNEKEYVNILRILQTMDKDGIPDNGIELPKDIKGKITFGSAFDANVHAFLSTNSVTRKLVSADAAIGHFVGSEIKAALTDKHVQFGSDTGDLYFYADGTLSHDTAPDAHGARTTNLPGTWFINRDTDLSMTVGVGHSARIIHFLDTSPIVGTKITSGSETGEITTLETIPKEKGALSVTNGFREAYCVGKRFYATFDGETDVDTFPFITKSTFQDENVNPVQTREGYSEIANDFDEMFVFNTDGTLDQYIPDNRIYNDSYNRYTITSVNDDGSFNLKIEVPEIFTGKLYLTDPTQP